MQAYRSSLRSPTPATSNGRDSFTSTSPVASSCSEPPCEGRCHDAPHVTAPPAHADAIASGTDVTGADHNWTIGAACAELAVTSTKLPNRQGAFDPLAHALFVTVG